MHKAQEQVRDFHRVNHLFIGEQPEWPHPKHVQKQLDLIYEEASELEQAVRQGDYLEAVDAVCDLLYVTYGMAVTLGFDVEPFFEEVQRANLEKTGGPKREDGKQLKPAGWHGPEHAEVFIGVYNTHHPSS